ncbi:hypothetical protein N0V93_000682 [Gnomoniopsis smithogilvyi]|uniref:Amino acid transporter transmembrane domain-containing protein n=1 Tax=Gnomoniopsis smithogilvyi TaxID=1191159 RepID=A0A9W8Z294_9PEZI|nr:hypothetical protein N0V93_000682 [Gnomoniopsis smithogilvyi]
MDTTEKQVIDTSPSREADFEIGTVTKENGHQESEVFGGGEVDFRTVGWIRASTFLIKQTFATGVLSMPSAMYFLGAVPGCISIVVWGAINTYLAYVQGKFKLAHPSLHTIVDAAEIVAFDLSGNKLCARITKEVAEVLYIMSWLLCIGLGVLAISTAFNAFSNHGACTVVFNLVATIICTAAGSIRKIHGLGNILYVGFFSAIISVLIVVIAVAVRDRPAAAPQTGPFELGFQAYPPPGTTFVQFWAACVAIYSSSSNTCGYLPLISEMRRPQDFIKSLWVCEAFVVSSYLSLATVVYAYCGKWVTSPSLGSAGDKIKVIAYGVALPGLIAVGMICVHVPAKSLFVRFLRGSRHLTDNTVTHWAVWLGCTSGCGLVGWLLAEAIPFYTSLVSLIGSLGFAPLGVCLPPFLWFSLHRDYRRGNIGQQALWWLHIVILLVGLLITVGGTYANIANIVAQLRAGNVGSAFSCADNSATLVG